MKRVTLSFVIVFLLLSLTSCGGSSFIDDGNGHKQYKDSSGNFVKNDWAEIKGKKYFFDMNGYLVTNQWVQDEYYVDDKGAMQTNYWHDDNNGKMYYLGEDGKYIKGTTMTIDGNEYAFNNSGELVKNAPYVSNGVGYYFGNDGKIDKTEGYKNINGTYCYVKDDGSLLLNDWKEDDGKWYYFNDMGLMLKNSFIDGGYYVDENGEMVIGRELRIGDSTYIFDNDGKSKIKQAPKISFRTIFEKNNAMAYGTVDNDDGMMEIKDYIMNVKYMGTMWMSKNAITGINKDLGIPASVTSKISQAVERGTSSGLQEYTNGNITLTWEVSTNSYGTVELWCLYSK